jgi:transcriptional regulator with XRE-family HTH domain
MLFADKIKELREKKQMVQRQFAAALGIDASMFSRIEHGERPAKRIPLLPVFCKGKRLKLYNR